MMELSGRALLQGMHQCGHCFRVDMGNSGL